MMMSLYKSYERQEESLPWDQRAAPPQAYRWKPHGPYWDNAIDNPPTPSLYTYLTEYSTQRANLTSLLYGYHGGIHGQSFIHLTIYQSFNLSQLGGRHGLRVVEIEAKLLVVHQRTLLIDVCLQDLSQSPVHDVREGVVGGNQHTALVVDMADTGIAGVDGSLLDYSDMQNVSSIGHDIEHVESACDE